MSDYILNPYQGDILPGTAAGAKLFVAATRGIVEESKRLQLSLDNALEIKEHCMKASHLYGWDTMVNIPHSYQGDGAPRNIINMLTNPEDTTLEMVRVQAAVTWNRVDFVNSLVQSNMVVDIDPTFNRLDRITFQRRVRSEMMSVWIDNTFSEASLSTFRLGSDNYSWTDNNGRVMEDGPTKLKLILDDMEAAKIVGADAFRQKIQNATLEKYGHDVKKAMEDIFRSYKEILRMNESYDSLRLSVFNCLRTSKNTTFRQYITRIEQDVSSNSGVYRGYTPEMIMSTAVAEYKNMIARGDWNKLDPMQSQMTALLTATAAAARRPRRSLSTGDLKNDKGGNGGGGSGGGGGGNGNTRFAAWQTEHKGDSIVRNGKTWWFCKHHNDGKGLYVRHPPSDHEKWAASKKKMKETGAKYPEYKPPDPLFDSSAHTVDGAGGTTDVKIDSTLELGAELKQVLASFGMSDNEANEAWSMAKERASKNC